MLGTLILIGVIALSVGLAVAHIYGIVLAFSKAWYMGAAALFIPGFATVVGISKLFFNKELLANV